MIIVTQGGFGGDIAFDDFDVSFCPGTVIAMGPICNSSIGADACTATVEWSNCAGGPADVEICPTGVMAGGAGCALFTGVTSPALIDLCAAGFASSDGPTDVEIFVTDGVGTGPSCGLTVPTQPLMCDGGVMANSLATENFDAGGAQTNLTAGQWNIDSNGTVSYTHLTLPTICSV